MRSRHLLTATATAAAISIGLSGIGAAPAAAVGICEITIQCEPEGLAVLADSDAIAAGTGNGVSASQALMEGSTVAGTAGAAPGVSGVSLGTAVAGGAGVFGTGVAAYLAIKGWAAGQVSVGANGTTGLTMSAGIPAGYSVSPTFPSPFGGWPPDGSVTRPLTVSFNGPAFGQAGDPTGTFSFATSPGRYMMLAYKVVLYGSVDWPTGQTHPNLATLWNIGGWLNSPYTTGLAIHISAGQRYVIEFGPGRSYGKPDNTAIGIWVPPGDVITPPSTPAGTGTVRQTLTCRGADGATATYTQDITVTLTPGASVPYAALPCPAGTVASSGKVDWLPAGGGTGQTIVPNITTDPTIQTIPDNYPDCVDSTCLLRLFQETPQGLTSCGLAAIACPDWYVDPNRTNNYQCQWGEYTVSLDRCSVFRDPGRILPNATLTPDGTMNYEPWPTLEITSDVVARKIADLSARYADPTACEVLGEFVRIDAPDASVPDTFLVCERLGIPVGLDFAAQSSSNAASRVIRALVDAVTAVEPPRLEPNCDLIADDGSCADQTIVQPGPDPAPAESGANKPPKSCLNDVARKDLIDAMPDQYHHMATKYGDWAAKFNDILADVNSRDPSATPLRLDDPTRAWNQVQMPHLGPHPAEYHAWVLRNMRNAYNDSSDTATFLSRFDEYVSRVVTGDPTIVRVAYWKCNRGKTWPTISG